MKKLLLTTLLPLAVFASGEGEIYDSYNYFSVGSESITYNEDYVTRDGQVVHSEAKATSPVYISGALVRVNNWFDFSMDMSSTLLPTQAQEKWQMDGALAQTNQFDAMISSMQFLGQFKLNNNHRIVLGPTYKLNSYKRYTFKDADGNILSDDFNNNGIVDAGEGKMGLIQERVATLYASAGYWYESSAHATSSTPRFRLNAIYGKPIWNEASNTGFEKVTFNSTNGYKIESNAYIGYPIFRGLELGIFGGYSYQKKSGLDSVMASNGINRIGWPENTLTLWQTGISFVWNFSKK